MATYATICNCYKPTNQYSKYLKGKAGTIKSRGAQHGTVDQINMKVIK